MAIGDFSNRRRGGARINRVQTTTNTTVGDKLIHELPGRRMNVHYWNQQIGEHDEATKFDHNLPPEQLSYASIEQLQLHVDSEIENGATPEQMEGSAYVGAGMMPTEGDVFLGKMVGNTPGLFTVTNVERVIYNVTDVYKINYALYKIITTEDDGIFNTLKLMSGEELVYDKDHHKHNTNPLVTKKQYTVLQKALESQDIVTNMLRDTVLKGASYVQAWTGSGYIVDEALSDFILRTIGGNMFDGYHGVQEIDIGITKDGYNLWDLLLTDMPIKYVKNKFCVTRRTISDCNTMKGYLLTMKSLGTIEFRDDVTGSDVYDVIVKGFLPPTDAKTLPTLSTTDYVMSDAFYTGKPTCAIERLVTSYLDETQLPVDDLTAICDEIYIWSEYERVYYLPILDLMLRYVLSNRGGIL